MLLTKGSAQSSFTQFDTITFEAFKPVEGTKSFECKQICYSIQRVCLVGFFKTSFKTVFSQEHLPMQRSYSVDANKFVKTAQTKAVYGICIDPQNEVRGIASYVENQVYIWDMRMFEKAFYTLPLQKTPIVKVSDLQQTQTFCARCITLYLNLISLWSKKHSLPLCRMCHSVFCCNSKILNGALRYFNLIANLIAMVPADR